MEAAFYTLDGTGRAVCGLCPHRCRIEKGHYGRCQTRYFDGTTLSALNYGKVTAIALDPIEKKPLYHFHGGAAILSLGSWGCNFTCPFCQLLADLPAAGLVPGPDAGRGRRLG